MKILIVDDEKFIRNGIKSILENNIIHNVELELAKNGKEALELFREKEFELIITDINMPFLNGLELIKEVREKKENQKIIVLSGFDDFEYARKAMKYGVRDYLLKPVDEKEIVQLVKKYLGIEENVEAVEVNNYSDVTLEESYIIRAKEYIEENYNKDINMAVVSNYVSLNYSYFSTIFNKNIGENFSDYLNLIRIEKSKKLLENLELKVHEISDLVGYKNQKHYSKLFKKYTGMTPVEYRLKKQIDRWSK